MQNACKPYVNPKPSKMTFSKTITNSSKKNSDKPAPHQKPQQKSCRDTNTAQDLKVPTMKLNLKQIKQNNLNLQKNAKKPLKEQTGGAYQQKPSEYIDLARRNSNNALAQK